jgi:plasmid stabilization system protein ParE
MPKDVKWSSLAESDLSNILDYLNRNWERKVASSFIDLTDNFIHQISINPKQFPLINKRKGIRKCVLTRHNTLFYRVKSSVIEILRIYDTRQDPNNLTF